MLFASCSIQKQALDLAHACRNLLDRSIFFNWEFPIRAKALLLPDRTNRENGCKYVQDVEKVLVSALDVMKCEGLSMVGIVLHYVPLVQTFMAYLTDFKSSWFIFFHFFRWAKELYGVEI